MAAALFSDVHGWSHRSHGRRRNYVLQIARLRFHRARCAKRAAYCESLQQTRLAMLRAVVWYFRASPVNATSRALVALHF